MKKVWQHIPCLIGLVFGMFFFCVTITGSDFSRIPGDLGDARFNNYILEHAHLYFTGKTSEFWNAPFIYPEKNIIAYSDNLLGTAPFYSLFRLSGNDMQDSFQWWFILLSMFNYLSCYILLFYLFRNPYAAAVGALLFAFSIALQSQISHAQMFPRFAIPLCMLSAVVYLKNLNPLYFLLSMLALVYQFYCGIYLGFLLLITLFFFYVYSFVFKFKVFSPKLTNARWWFYMLGTLAIATLLLLPLMLPYIENTRTNALYPYWEVVNTIPSLRSFFYVHHGTFLWKFLENTGNGYEAYWDHQIFPGALALLSLVCFITLVTKNYFLKKGAVRSENDTRMTILGVTAITVFIFFLRYQDYSLYKLIFQLPGFASMRALQRVITIELLFFAIALAYVCHLIFVQTNKLNYILFFLALGIFYFDNFIKHDCVDVYDKKVSHARIEKLNAKLSHLKKGSLISYEPDTVVGSTIYYQLDAMISAQQNEMICLNGYTANPPDFYSYYWLSPNRITRTIWCTIKKIPESEIHVIK